MEMKQFILVAALIATAQISFAQPLTSNELIEMAKCDDYNCIKKAVEPRGYEVAMNDERPDGFKSYAFNSKLTYKNESNENIAAPYRLEFHTRPGDSAVAVNYHVNNKEQRELLLDGFENEGFEYLEAGKTESTADNVATIYVSERHPDMRMKVTNFEKTYKKKKYMEYDFEVIRMTKAKKEKKEENPLRVK